jgi:hypothetical protein
MAANAGVIVSDIQDWVIDTDIADSLLWGLMDEVIDNIMDNHDPWFCFNYAQVARTAANHMNDSDIIPPAYEAGVLAVDANIVSGATVPDNSEYLNALLYPTGLSKPIKVYYGPPTDDVELDYIGWEEFEYRYPHHADGGGNTPSNYTLYNGTILVAPTPSLAVTLSIYGVYRPTEISANADTSEWITNAGQLLKYGVMRKLILYNYEEDSGRFQMVNRMYRQARLALYSASKHRTHRVRRAKSRRAGTWRT